jgi:hypothetical protein
MSRKNFSRCSLLRRRKRSDIKVMMRCRHELSRNGPTLFIFRVLLSFNLLASELVLCVYLKLEGKGSDEAISYFVEKKF